MSTSGHSAARADQLRPDQSIDAVHAALGQHSAKGRTVDAGTRPSRVPRSPRLFPQHDDPPPAPRRKPRAARSSTVVVGVGGGGVEAATRAFASRHAAAHTARAPAASSSTRLSAGCWLPGHQMQTRRSVEPTGPKTNRSAWLSGSAIRRASPPPAVCRATRQRYRKAQPTSAPRRAG